MPEQLSRPAYLPNGGGGVAPLNVLAVDGDPAMCDFYREAIRALGHQVCVAGSGRQAIELCRASRPDLLITEVRLPDLHGLDAAVELCRDQPVPVIVVSDCHDPEVLRCAPEALVFAYLLKPVAANALGPAIAVAMSGFQRLKAAREEAAQLRQELEDRKVIERAKGMVMRYARLGEEEAYQRLRKVASDRNHKLVEVAHMVVAAGEVFRDLERPEQGRPTDNGSARPLRVYPIRGINLPCGSRTQLGLPWGAAD